VIRYVDEVEGCLGWIEDQRMRRTSHALAADGRVWLVDPIDGDGVEERVRNLGEPAGVIQLLDRHGRDAAAFAERLGVPLHVVPPELGDTPFRVLPILRRRLWSEVALWWPERRVLVCADALGTARFFRAGDEPIGVHPLLRVLPPRSLRGLEPLHVLVGHGRGLHGDDAAAEVERALATARRRLPQWLLGTRRAFGERNRRVHAR
jgi:hypothetical protein